MPRHSSHSPLFSGVLGVETERGASGGNLAAMYPVTLTTSGSASHNHCQAVPSIANCHSFNVHLYISQRSSSLSSFAYWLSLLLVKL